MSKTPLQIRELNRVGQNYLINGNFDFWQRSSTDTYSGSVWRYGSVDRWKYFTQNGGTGQATISQVSVSSVDTPFDATYVLQWNQTVAVTSNYTVWSQPIEGVNTISNQQVTISFWARLTSGSLSGLRLRIRQNFGSGGSTQVDTYEDLVVPGSDWQLISKTVTIPSIVGKTIGADNYLGIEVVQDGTSTYTMQYAQMMLNKGPYVHPFALAGLTLAGELAACQRYAIKIGGETAYNKIGQGLAINSDAVAIVCNTHTQMRVPPSVLNYGGTLASQFVVEGNGSNITGLTGIALGTTNNSSYAPVIQVTKTGAFSAREIYILSTNASSSAYILLDAELQ